MNLTTVLLLWTTRLTASRDGPTRELLSYQKRSIEIAPKTSKVSLNYGLPGFLHQPGQECQVMLGEQDDPQDLLLHHEVPDNPSGEPPARLTRASALQRLRGQRVLGVTQVHTAGAGERGTHPCGPRGQYAVE